MACPAPAIAPAATPQAVAEPSAPASEVLATISIDAAPGALQSAFGSIWTTNHRSNTISRIDPSTSKVKTTIPVEDNGQSIGIGGMSIGAHYIWLPVFVNDATQLWRLDPSTNQFDKKLPIDSLGGIAEAGDALWVDIDVSSGPAKRDALERIDPDTGAVLATIDLAPASSGLHYTPTLAYGLGSLWTVIGNNAVARIDPSSRRVVATISTPSWPSGYGMWAFFGNHVYLAMYDFNLARIDAGTNCVDGVLYLGAELKRQADPTAGPLGLAPAPEGLYVEFDRGALALVDPDTLTVRKAVRLDEQDYVAGITDGFGSLWYSTFGNNTVLRLKPL